MPEVTKEEFLQYYITLTDNALSKRLDLTRAQMKTAYEQRNDKAMMNLQAMESALIEARLRKTA